jgi:hypothetical protein
MSPEAPNPESRSNNALLCFCIGAGLCIASYVLGIGAIIGVALSGGDPAVAIGSLFGMIGVVLMGLAGFVLAIVGGIWIIIRVIADQRGDNEEKRYRDVGR